ncbi:MAG: hypothetical protein JO202_11625 [Ktedonobacteraceae bacterium]|nr:hypothetical protein [Ktedonobacteraceae bacterium]
MNTSRRAARAIHEREDSESHHQLNHKRHKVAEDGARPGPREETGREGIIPEPLGEPGGKTKRQRSACGFAA